ncbi:transaldolase family protein [Clostridium septicum]|uniref:transaldolase family protein n=1 Tax=Clostridium septicum TaxID=1504 RepID=UPI001D154955|nr:transaldolase family protein [Clostridium septicum]UEC22323.1 hypothetical protein LK444_11955 [Clostridium septicum]WLF71043.1 transaldolase family protein [Clostridium septicum]
MSLDLLKEIREIIGDDSMLRVQVLSRKAKEMLGDSDYLKNYVGGNLYIKVTVTKEGIKEIKMLKETEYKVTATDIFTVQDKLLEHYMTDLSVESSIENWKKVFGVGALV